MKQRLNHTLAGCSAGIAILGGIKILETGNTIGLLPAACAVLIASLSIRLDLT